MNDQALRDAEDRIANEIGSWSDFKRKLVYKILNSLGERISNIDHDIAKAWKKEQGQ